MAFAVLWTIKYIPDTSIGFPLVLLAICVLRKFLSCIFTTWELRVLDDLLPDQREQAYQEKIKLEELGLYWIFRIEKDLALKSS